MRSRPKARPTTPHVARYFDATLRLQCLGLATVFGLHALVASILLSGHAHALLPPDTRSLQVALIDAPAPLASRPTDMPLRTDTRPGRVQPARYVPPPPPLALASRRAPAKPADDPTPAEPAASPGIRLAVAETPALQSVSENCSLAALLGRPAEFPTAALLAGLRTGRVVVEFEALPDSRVRIVKVDASDPSFTGAALRLIQQLHCRAGQYRQAFNYSMTD